MYNIFNMGIGFILTVDADDADKAIRFFMNKAKMLIILALSLRVKAFTLDVEADKVKKIAVFASGTGSNFQAIIDAIGSGELRAEQSLLVCDKPGAAVIEKADAANVDSLFLIQKNINLRVDFETELLNNLEKHKCGLCRACRIYEAHWNDFT